MRVSPECRPIWAYRPPIERACTTEGGGIEGAETGEWVLVDAGDIIVHIMQPSVRAYYNLEELWAPPSAKRRAAA